MDGVELDDDVAVAEVGQGGILRGELPVRVLEAEIGAFDMSQIGDFHAAVAVSVGDAQGVLPVHGALCCNRIVDGEDRSVVVHCGCNGDWHYAINIPEEEFDDLDRVSEALEWFDTK